MVRLSEGTAALTPITFVDLVFLFVEVGPIGKLLKNHAQLSHKVTE